MAVAVMVQSGRLYDSKIVIIRDGKDIYGFDIIFNFLSNCDCPGSMKQWQCGGSWGDGTVRTVIIVQKLSSPEITKIFMDLVFCNNGSECWAMVQLGRL